MKRFLVSLLQLRGNNSYFGILINSKKVSGPDNKRYHIQAMEFCHVIAVIRVQLFCAKSCFDCLIYAFAENSLSCGGQYLGSFKQEKRELLNNKLNNFAHSVIFLGQRTNSWNTWNKSNYSFTCPTNLICAQARLNRGFLYTR